MSKKESFITNPHKIAHDLQQALVSSKKMQPLWQNITPLARNEWICWIESAKKPETRIRRFKRTIAELKEGKRRPCCWGGCQHRQ